MADIITDAHEFRVDTTLQAWWLRPIYRHSSNEGSVIEFDYWGTRKKLFVADAKYRAATLAYDTTPRSHGNPQLTVTDTFFNGTEDSNAKALKYTKDDAWIQSTYAALKNDGTAKSNTDILMGFGTTAAAHHCRSQNISGVGELDLPNLYELIILYLESDNIDALDPTVESNKGKALGKMSTGGRFNFNGGRAIWSSTEYSASNAWMIRYEGNAANYSQSNYRYGVVPVAELDV